METRTLTQLIAAVREQSDTRGLLDRHPDADLTGLINRAARDMRGMVTVRGAPYYLTATTAATLASTRVTDEDYSEIPFPATAEHIHGVDVQLGTAGQGGWRSLQPISWGQRRAVGLQTYPLTSPWGPPRYFAIRTLPTSTAGTIAIFPFADQGMYKVWHLPAFTDLVAGGDTFSGLPSWIGWIIQCASYWLAQEDDEADMMAAANAERLRLEALITESLGSIQSAGPLRPRRPRGGFGYRRR